MKGVIGLSEQMYLLQYLVMSLDGLSTGIMMEILYRKSYPKRGFLLGRIISYWLLALVICFPSYILHYKIWTMLNLAANIAGVVFLNVYYYRSSVKEALLSFFFYYVSAATAELIAMLLQPDIMNAASDWTQTMMIPFVLTTHLIALISKIIVALFLTRKEADSNSEILLLIWLCTAFLVFYLLVVFDLDEARSTPNNMNAILRLFISIGGVILPGAVLSFYSIHSKTNIELEQSIELSRMQKQLYEQVNQNHHEVLDIRNIYSSSIESLINQVQSGQPKKAIEMANQEIKDQTSGKKKSYSVNRVVNAIVFAKAHEANKNGIALKTELKIPAELEIDPLDLCRILGNLLDNAIRSCIQFQKEAEAGDSKYLDRINLDQRKTDIQTDIKKHTPMIELEGRLLRDLLVITCSNTALQNKEKKIYGQGYGQQILRSVARKYDGNFSREYVGSNRYEALIHLTNQKSASKLEFSKGLVNNSSV